MFCVSVTARALLTLALSSVVVACGEAAPSDDGSDGDGSPGADGGANAGALAELEDDWKFEAAPVEGGEGALCCDVEVGSSAFEITCPTARNQNIGEACMQRLEALHIFGTLGGALEGTFEELVQYEGSGCSALGFTTGAPYAEPAFAVMEAERLEISTLGDFLAALGGKWSWQLRDARDMVVDTACEVDIGLAPMDAAALKVTVACAAGEPFPVSSTCSAQDFDSLEVRLGLGGLTGDLAKERRHTGEACGGQFPSTVRVVQLNLAATRGAVCPVD